MGMNIGRGLAKFTEGLVNGYTAGVKSRREQEIHDAQMQKIRDEQAMTAEIKKLSETKAAASDAYTVVDADGNKTVYADAAQAHDAVALNPGAQVQRKFVVAGKQYDTPEEANVAVEAANSPLAKTRMAANIALKYNRPDIYDAHMKAYKMGVQANHDDMQQSFYEARATNDLGQLADLYNKRMPNGVHVEFAPQEDGTVMMTTLKGDKPIGQPKPFKSADDVWTAGEEHMMKTPENALEVWKTKGGFARQDRGLELQSRSVDQQGRQIDSAVKRTDAEVAEMPTRLRLLGRQVGAQETQAQASLTGANAQVTGANAQAANAETTRLHALTPTIKEGLNAETGNLEYTALVPSYNKDTGITFTSQAVPGSGLKMKPKPVDTVSAGIIGNGGGNLVPGGAAGGTKPMSAADIAAAVQAALPPKNPAPAGGLSKSVPRQ